MYVCACVLCSVQQHSPRPTLDLPYGRDKSQVMRQCLNITEEFEDSGYLHFTAAFLLQRFGKNFIFSCATMLKPSIATLFIVLLCSRCGIPFSVLEIVSLRYSSPKIHISTQHKVACERRYSKLHSSGAASLNPFASNLAPDGMPFSGLLNQYLTQNARPKYNLCLKLLSKVVECEGPDAAMRTTKRLEVSVSTESFRLISCTLFSALVQHRHRVEASSHLRHLLLKYDGRSDLDAEVAADLLQLFMEVDDSSGIVLIKWESKKRALEAATLYNNMLEIDDDTHNFGMVSGIDGRSTSSRAAIDRIHEYGARAFAEIENWGETVTAMGFISDNHLVTPSVMDFSTKLLEKLLEQHLQQEQQEKLRGSAVTDGMPSEQQRSKKAHLDLKNVQHQTALDIALLQPLVALSVNNALLHISLLVISASPAHVQVALEYFKLSRNSKIRSIEGAANMINTMLTEESTAISSDATSQYESSQLQLSLPRSVTLELVRQLFSSGCSVTQLHDAITDSYSSEFASDGNSWAVGTSAAKHDYMQKDNSHQNSEVDEEDDKMLVHRAVRLILTTACMLRDDRIAQQDVVDQIAQQCSNLQMELPRLINGASSSMAASDYSAIDYALCVLALSLRPVGQQQHMSAILQSIEDTKRTPVTPLHESVGTNDGQGNTLENTPAPLAASSNLYNRVESMGPRSSYGPDSLSGVRWCPSDDLLGEVSGSLNSYRECCEVK